MIKLNIQGNLLNRTEALEAGRAKIDFSNVIKPFIDAATGAAAGGYIKFSNGIKICWGYASAVMGAKTINFPVEYTSAPAVSFTRIATSAAGISNALYWCHISSNVTTTGFIVYGDTNYQTKYLWIAIGV